MLPSRGLELRYYLTAGGESPFESWFDGLDSPAAAKISVALVRLGQGNTSNAKPVGEGVSEYRLDWRPGYRVYFGRDGETLVILLTGGTKQRQQRDIARTTVDRLQAAAQTAGTMNGGKGWR